MVHVVSSNYVLCILNFLASNTLCNSGADKNLFVIIEKTKQKTKYFPFLFCHFYLMKFLLSFLNYNEKF